MQILEAALILHWKLKEMDPQSNLPLRQPGISEALHLRLSKIRRTLIFTLLDSILCACIDSENQHT